MTSNADIEREYNELLRTLVEGSFDSLTVAIDGKIIDANEAFARLSGYPREELIGKTVTDFTTPESASIALASLRAGVETPYEVVGVRRDGSQIDVEVLGRNITYRGQAARISAFRDITARKRAEAAAKQVEERMAAAQKLENLGMLAGGISHDFNNLLLVVMGHAELAMAAPDPAAVREHLQQICTAAERASELTKQLLMYAGRTPTVSTAIDLGEVVRDTADLLRVTVPQKVRIELELGSQLPAIEADPAQVRQIVMNLITNAADALGDHAGEIRLRTARVDVDAATLACAHLDATEGPGQYVLLEVCDDGCGMDAGTRSRVFDPFFTTKFAGRGLGLASVLGIVRAHRGAISVTSELGHGTVFRTYFRPSSRSSLLTAAKSPSSIPPYRTHGLVLIVDDEPLIRALTREVVQKIGMQALEACDGEEALAQFGERAGEIDLVLMDMTMPRMSGGEALREMRAVAPETPVILLSGFHEPSDVGNDRATSFLAKPFELGALVDAIRNALEGRRAKRA